MIVGANRPIGFETAAHGRGYDGDINACVGILRFSECDPLFPGSVGSQFYGSNDFAVATNKVRYLPEVNTDFRQAGNITGDGFYGQIEIAGALYGTRLIHLADEVLATGRAKPPRDLSLISQFGDARNWFANQTNALASQYSLVMTEFRQKLFYGLEPAQVGWQSRQGFPNPGGSDSFSRSLDTDVSSPFSSFDLREDSRYPFDGEYGHVYQTLVGELTEQNVFNCRQYRSMAGMVADYESYDEQWLLRIRLLRTLRELKQHIARTSALVQLFADAVGFLVAFCWSVIPHAIATSQRPFFTHHGAHPPDRQHNDLAAVSGGGKPASH